MHRGWSDGRRCGSTYRGRQRRPVALNAAQRLGVCSCLRRYISPHKPEHTSARYHRHARSPGTGLGARAVSSVHRCVYASAPRRISPRRRHPQGAPPWTGGAAPPDHGLCRAPGTRRDMHRGDLQAPAASSFLGLGRLDRACYSFLSGRAACAPPAPPAPPGVSFGCRTVSARGAEEGSGAERRPACRRERTGATIRERCPCLAPAAEALSEASAHRSFPLAPSVCSRTPCVTASANRCRYRMGGCNVKNSEPGVRGLRALATGSGGDAGGRGPQAAVAMLVGADRISAEMRAIRGLKGSGVQDD